MWQMLKIPQSTSAVLFKYRLETQPEAQLNMARIRLACGQPKPPARHIVLDAQKVDMVEDVQEFKPELQSNAFGDLVLFSQTKVCVPKGWLAESVYLLVSFGRQRCWRHELPRSENTISQP